MSTPTRAPFVASIVALAVLGWSLPARAATCDGVAEYQAVVSGASSGAHQVVPLVIHLMERPGHPCEVRKAWTARQITTVFGPDAQNQGSVSAADAPPPSADGPRVEGRSHSVSERTWSLISRAPAQHGRCKDDRHDR